MSTVGAMVHPRGQLLVLLRAQRALLARVIRVRSGRDSSLSSVPHLYHIRGVCVWGAREIHIWDLNICRYWEQTFKIFQVYKLLEVLK